MEAFRSARTIGLICMFFALFIIVVYADTPLYTDSSGNLLSGEFATTALSSYVDSSGNSLSNDFALPFTI